MRRSLRTAPCFVPPRERQELKTVLILIFRDNLIQFQSKSSQFSAEIEQKNLRKQ